MLRRITLENFMSHRHTVIDLADGLTVLIGPNNCGKSAVVAALQILASNQPSTHVVRHGETNCRITVETDDGHTISWNRCKGKVSYTLNGEDVHRLNRGEVPSELHSLLRLPTVEADSGKTSASYDIHFGEQKSPIFLLGDPGRGSRAASFFASTSDATHLIAMQHRHRQNVRDHKRDAKQLQDEIASTEASLFRFTSLDDIDQRLQQAEAEHEQIQVVDRSCAELRQLLLALIRAKQQTTLYRAQTAALRRLGTPPPQHDLPAIESILGELRSSRKRQRLHAAEAACFKSLNTPPPLAPAVACRSLLTELQQVELHGAIHRRREASLQSLRPPPVLSSTDPLRGIIRELPRADAETQRSRRILALTQPVHPPAPAASTSELQTAILQLARRHADFRRQSRIFQSFVRLSPAPPFEETESRAELVISIREALESATDRRNAFAAAEAARQTCRDAIEAFVQRTPKCPTCGSELKLESLLSRSPGSAIHQQVLSGSEEQGS